MRFTPDLLDDIRARLPVSEVVGRRVKLKKAGREWKGLSPFNKERTPSFFVNDQKGFYHDFSSGKHGDIFGFVMDTEGVTFPEAVERLAAMAGLSVPKMTEAEVLQIVRAAMEGAGFWDEFVTDWACLDCELMPWSAKAQELLKQQYAAVGASARATLADEIAALEQASGRGLNVSELLAQTTARRAMAEYFVAAYHCYCGPVEDVNDHKLAPFHLLATEGKVHADKPHDWHMQTPRKIRSKRTVASRA